MMSTNKSVFPSSRTHIQDVRSSCSIRARNTMRAGSVPPAEYEGIVLLCCVQSQMYHCYQIRAYKSPDQMMFSNLIQAASSKVETCETWRIAKTEVPYIHSLIFSSMPVILQHKSIIRICYKEHLKSVLVMRFTNRSISEIQLI